MLVRLAAAPGATAFGVGELGEPRAAAAAGLFAQPAPLVEATSLQTKATSSDPQDTVRAFLDAVQRDDRAAALTFLTPDLRQRVADSGYAFADLLGSGGARAIRLFQTTVEANREAHVLALFAAGDELRYRELALRLVAGEGWRINAFTPLVVEEHQLVANIVHRPDMTEYGEHLTPRLLEQRQPWREPSPEQFVQPFNAELATFGYRLTPKQNPNVAQPLFDLYREQGLVQADLDAIWPLALSEFGDDFALLARVLDGPTILVRRDRVEPWNMSRHAAMPPVFVGRDLVMVHADAAMRRFSVQRGDEIVYRFSVPVARVDSPVKGLWSWNGHWVLEVDGQVVVDGTRLTQQIGCDEIFGWRLLDGQPFYFCKQGSQVSISYAGQVLPYRYDDVFHDATGAPAAYNVAGNGTMVWFHALYKGMWQYVEMGIYAGHT